nr:hypothetical protein [uncultured Methanoregula sp.]
MSADGMMGVYDHDTWTLLPESQQLAAIHYDDNKENLLLSITPDKEMNGDKAVWIYPIPSKPENATLDMMDEFPYFHGFDADYGYKNSIMSVSGWMIGYATAPAGLMYGYPLYQVLMLRSGPSTLGMGSGVSDEQSVTVYQTVERYGVTTELVTAKDVGSLSHHLLSKGMIIPDSSINTFDDYIGKDYSFVVTYISNVSEYNAHSGKSSNNVISSFVSFPTKHIYFPLKPTRVYGGRQIPVTIYVTGMVTPELYDRIQPATEVQYYYGNVGIFDDNQRSLFFNGYREKESNSTEEKYRSMSAMFAISEYTKIRINSPSNAFTDDLWINDVPPTPDPLKSFLQPYLVFLGIIIYILFSMFACLAAGMIWFRNDPFPKKKLLLHGLWNCLTMVGFLVASKKVFKKENGKKLFPFVLLFYLIFASLISVSVVILLPSLVKYIIYAWGLAIVGPLIFAIYPSHIMISYDYFFLGIMPIIVGFIHIVFLCLIGWSLYNWLDGENKTIFPRKDGQGIESKIFWLLIICFLILVIYILFLVLTFMYQGRVFDCIQPVLIITFIFIGIFIINIVLVCLLRWVWNIISNAESQPV